MKINLIVFMLICVSLKAQNPDKVALTAGCELSDFHAESPNSITSGLTKIEFENTNYNSQITEQQLSAPQTKLINRENTNKNSYAIYSIAFLLLVIAIFFITKKNKSSHTYRPDLETEENDIRKKELWNVLSEPQIEE